MSKDDLFSPSRLRANWQRVGEPQPDDAATETLAKASVAERVSLVELVAELRALWERQEQGVDRFMEHAFDCLVEGVGTGDQGAIAEALNTIEDLVDESGLRNR